ncbi:VOC family protein [Ferrimicrobium sp.]|uniref:VOC family protein n=1 Tax=Ferrimicrobium sp. TaxID=2926050 RepID=UPI00261D786F|nr:VOC family protein [Ferrimicrobium sp.]
MTYGELHHVELWVPDLGRAVDSLGWLLVALGYTPYQDWAEGKSWRLGDTYIVVEQSRDLTSDHYDRCRAGLNHLAFHAGDIGQLADLTARATRHGWTLLFSEGHPSAGGADDHASYLENSDGFEIELVANL